MARSNGLRVIEALFVVANEVSPECYPSEASIVALLASTALAARTVVIAKSICICPEAVAFATVNGNPEP